MNIITTSFNKVKFFTKKNSPEICLISAITTSVAALAVAIARSQKAVKALTDYKETRVGIQKAIDDKYTDKDGNVYTEEIAKGDVNIAKASLVKGLAVAYAPAIALEAVSIGMMFGGFKIMKGREASLVAAATLAQKSFDKYRDKVEEILGKEKEEEVYKDSIKQEKKEDKAVTEKEYMDNCKRYNGAYAALFDETSYHYHRDADANWCFVMEQQKIANQMLISNGYLMLNDVYDMLGIKRTIIGQTHGWIYDTKNKDRHNYVDFGLASLYGKEELDPSIWISPNCDGFILGSGRENFELYAR